MQNSLQVNLGSVVVGILTMLRNENIFFEFDEEYLSNSQRLILSQSFIGRDKQNLLASKTTRMQMLPPFFSNLLPEGRLRDYLAERGGIKSSNEFLLLQLLGKDLPGAVTVTAIGSNAEPIISERRRKSTKDSASPLHFSLAGVQLKFSALARKQGGLTIPADGIGGNWILKLPSQHYANVPQNEYAMMRLAQSVGIPIPEMRLVNISEIEGLPAMGLIKEKQALAVKRFDRGVRGMRIHMEDFAQVYGIYPHKKYEGVSFANISEMVWNVAGENSLVDLIRRFVLMLMIGNGDMHLKNWSFIYRDGRVATLAPAYDFLSTIPYIPEDGLALNFAGSKKMQEISYAHFKALANKAKLPENLVLQTVKATALEIKSAWNSQKKHAEIPAVIKKCIDLHMKSSALFSP